MKFYLVLCFFVLGLVIFNQRIYVKEKKLTLDTLDTIIDKTDHYKTIPNRHGDKIYWYGNIDEIYDSNLFPQTNTHTEIVISKTK